MRFAIAVAVLAWAAQYSGSAAADLYRWVDAESGSIKFSSYPPPWYGDPAKEARAPKVEVIPDRSAAPSSGPKPEELARPEPRSAPRPVERSPDRLADRSPDGPVDKSPDRPAGRTPDGPGEKPDAAATKQRLGDGR